MSESRNRERDMHPRPDPYDEYSDRIGELISGRVKKMYRGDVIVDLGRDVEAFVPRSEQAAAEQWSQGERIRAVITNVYKRKGPQVEVSRTSSELLRRLFEQEVPEIRAGKVVIKAAVREPNECAKIAVIATESGIDPVNVCLGPKGSHVQAISRELRGE
ncbi:MAG TPA: S1 RNA-binding domain-containing protein, partial [Pyrinomonadaceae bacterium]|nr:S1 RNA-binding domain-containing protein [Pyrinomonadaceae bacterium]